MRYTIIILLALFTVTNSFAGKAIWTLPYSVKKDSLTKHLGQNLAKMIIHITNFDDYNAGITKEIQVKDQKNTWRTYSCSNTNELEMLVSPGKQNFEFFINAKFYSVEMNEHELLASHTQWINMSFAEKSASNNDSKNPDTRTYVLKPVIYTYGNETPCTLSVNPVGTFTFTYPEYKENWTGIAHLDGSFTHNGTAYPYLFWESEQNYVFQSSTNGFRVKKDNITAFLEQKLQELGFTSKEKTDFITFWGPKLVQEDEVFIQFELGDMCNRYASLNCVPTPDAVNRMYISFAPWREEFTQYLKNETFKPYSRDGFTLLEWGGHSITLDFLN